jgi:hypothetical protein
MTAGFAEDSVLLRRASLCAAAQAGTSRHKQAQAGTNTHLHKNGEASLETGMGSRWMFDRVRCELVICAANSSYLITRQIVTLVSYGVPFFYLPKNIRDHRQSFDNETMQY